MKIFVVCSTLDLEYKLGCTPSWWQLLKGLYETGNEVIAVPFLGDPIESVWWRCYPNPCLLESKLFNRYLEWGKKRCTHTSCKKSKSSLLSSFSENYIRSKWEKFLFSIFEREGEIDMLIFMNVPLNYIRGIPEKIQSTYGIPVAYYDGDMPTILPKYDPQRWFKFNYYLNTDLSGFNAFFTNSKGVIPDLKEMGAKNVHPLYFGADPDLFKPLHVNKDIDISFFGNGSEFREEWMKKLIKEPSEKLPEINFTIGGLGIGIPLGNAHLIGHLHPYSAIREFCCRSKICLNIPRWTHASVYASATARLFELAAFGACIVSQPYNGIEEWFDIGKEIIIAKNETEILSIYQYLLDSDEERQKIGESARLRILKDHTYQKRAEDLISIMKGGKF